MATYSLQTQLTAGEKAVATMLEVFGASMTANLQNIFVHSLDGLHEDDLNKTVADFTGQNRWDRHESRRGKMPMLDEFMARARENEDERLKRWHQQKMNDEQKQIEANQTYDPEVTRKAMEVIRESFHQAVAEDRSIGKNLHTRESMDEFRKEYRKLKANGFRRLRDAL